MSIASLIYRITKQDFFSSEQVFEGMPAHIYCKDKNGVYLWCNDGQAKTFGFTNGKAVIGKTDLDLLHDSALAAYIKTNDLQIMEAGEQKIIEETVFINDENRTYLSQKTPLRNKRNEVIGILGVSIDITARKRIEIELLNAKGNAETDNQDKTEFLEQLLAEMPAHVYWKDKQGMHLGCNDNQARSFGFASGKEVIGKTDFDLLHGNAGGDVLAEMSWKNDQHIMASGNRDTVEEQAIVNGEERIYLSQKVPLRNKQQDIIGILGISVDITDRKRAEQEIIRAKEKAEEANKFKVDFLYNMRHDIRTPFNGLLGMSEYLWNKETEPERKEFLGYIKQSAKELLEYFEYILDYLKIEQEVDNKQILKKFYLQDLINKIVTIEMPAAKAKQLEFKFNYDLAIPRVLIGDRYKLYRVLINLISNAIKFTEQGQVIVTAKLIPSKKDNQVLVRVIIEDTGIGIPEDKIEYIYEKFTRLIPSGTSSHKGMGLGLTVVKELVNIMGGEIDVQSKVGVGTTFNCTMPFILPLTDDFVEEE